MLKKIFQPKVCVAIIIVLLMISICLVPFTSTFFMGTGIPTGTCLVLLPLVLGIIYAVLISIETEPEKRSEKRKNGFAIAYAGVFALFVGLNIWVIIYALMKM